MAVVKRTLYPKSILFDEKTLKGGADGLGGPLSIRVEVSTEKQADYVGNEIWPTFNQATRRSLSVFIGIRDISEFEVYDINTRSDMVITLSNERSGEDEVMTIANMVFTDRRASQDQAITGDWEAEFTHESADGSTDPITFAS